MENVRFVPNIHNPQRLVITLPFSKTNRPGHRQILETRTVYKRTDGGPCPVELMKKICKNRMDKHNEPVFTLNDGRAWDYDTISSVLKGYCTYFGLDPKYYTSHALRIGGATDLFEQGKTLQQIMIAFNWKSKRVAMGYIRVENPDLEKFE